MSIVPTRPPSTVDSLATELAAEVAAHQATRVDLLEETIRAEVRGYALSLFRWWALPWLARDEQGEPFVTFTPPEPDEPLPVDVSVAPLIFDRLVAETAAALSGPVPRRRRLRGRGRRLVAVALAAAALAAAGLAFRRSRA